MRDSDDDSGCVVPSGDHAMRVALGDGGNGVSCSERVVGVVLAPRSPLRLPCGAYNRDCKGILSAAAAAAAPEVSEAAVPFVEGVSAGHGCCCTSAAY